MTYDSDEDEDEDDDVSFYLEEGIELTTEPPSLKLPSRRSMFMYL